MSVRPISALREFLQEEAASGVVLIAAAVIALVLANLPATADAYHHLLHLRAGPVLSDHLGPMTVHLWINDGLMALFFLLVGLEVKREVVTGRLARPDARRLPVIAAIAGMAVPAIVYLTVVGDAPGLQRGWAIPAATDIAFALGVLALLGRRVPPALKLLLTTVAIVDDMGAVAIIALAYTGHIAVAPLAAALVVLALLYVLGRRGVGALWPYLVLIALLWLFVLQSGVHATIAGVLGAAFVPVRGKDAPLPRLEHKLHPWVAFGVVPLFALANAGVPLGGAGAALGTPLVLAIAGGLVIGKQLGILGAVWGAVRLGIAPRPAGVSWLQMWGMALVAGIGFTMSLFIGALAFVDAGQADAVKIGVLIGSLVSALAGTTVLLLAPRSR